MAPAQTSSTGSRLTNNHIYLGVLALVIIIVLAFVASQHLGSAKTHSPAALNSTAVSTNPAAGSLSPQSVISTSSGGGPGNIYLSSKELGTLFGPGGEYNVTIINNQTILSQFVQSTNLSAAMARNISRIWMVRYSQLALNSSNHNTTGTDTMEIVYGISDAKALYDSGLNSSAASNLSSGSVDGQRM